jgi:dolichyl-phosphate-mannose-protein mannosyltransferase
VFPEIPFLTIKIEDGRLLSLRTNTEFESFPYAVLRAESAVFGVGLLIAFYWFILSLTRDKKKALWGMFFLAAENAFLIETRLILMNGSFLFFGFLALALLFREKPKPVIAGILLGLSLSVKLIGVVFIVPALLYFALKDRMRTMSHTILPFLFTGFSVLFALWLTFTAIAAPFASRVAFMQSLDPLFKERLYTPSVSDNPPFMTKVSFTTFEFLRDMGVSANKYIVGVGPHPAQSAWFSWPFMYKPFTYFYDDSMKIALVGNPFVWATTTLVMLGGLFLYLFRIMKKRANMIPAKQLLIGSYLYALLPFAFIARPAFLYHYFPAYLFGIAFLSFAIVEHLETLAPRKRIWLSALIIFATLVGFAFSTPYTYGL